MPTSIFNNFRTELIAIRDAVNHITKKTIRDDALRERIRNLFRIWITSVKPSIESLSPSHREMHKLTAELESLAGLANKIKAISEYRKRIRRSIELSDNIILYLPPHSTETQSEIIRNTLFLNEIPDLPLELVPNSLLGWRENIRTFLQKHPFDNSIFLMIRYRPKNDQLINAIKRLAKRHGYYVVIARDHQLTDDLYNPIACLLSCAKGLVVFDEPEKGQVFNPNVAYELGMMHLLGRDCRVLKHASLKVLHTDILMKLYYEYGNPQEAIEMIRDWITIVI